MADQRVGTFYRQCLLLHKLALTTSHQQKRKPRGGADPRGFFYVVLSTWHLALLQVNGDLLDPSIEAERWFVGFINSRTGIDADVECSAEAQR